MSSSIIIADASVLITLSRINRLYLLQKFNSEIFVATIVRNEYGNPLPGWIRIKDPIRFDLGKFINLDKGETSSIALALENEN